MVRKNDIDNELVNGSVLFKKYRFIMFLHFFQFLECLELSIGSNFKCTFV